MAETRKPGEPMDESEDEACIAGQIIPEVLRFRDASQDKKPLSIMIDNQQTNPEDYELRCRVVEKMLDSGRSVEDLILNRIILEQAIVHLHSQYKNGNRADRNGYLGKIEQYFLNKNQDK